MENKYHYDSVSGALNELKSKGFTSDFNLQENAIAKNPQQYEIQQIYRYEGNSNPDDEAVVYGLKSQSGEKGVFVTGFAANSISEAAQALIAIEIKNKNK
jgi:predicted transcriptional regulator YdeE